VLLEREILHHGRRNHATQRKGEAAEDAREKRQEAEPCRTVRVQGVSWSGSREMR